MSNAPSTSELRSVAAYLDARSRERRASFIGAVMFRAVAKHLRAVAAGR